MENKILRPHTFIDAFMKIFFYYSSRRPIIHSLSVIILCFSIQPLLSQEISSTLKFNHISIDDGLSHSQVNCMLQDSHGFLWFGTQDGLNRYDGHSFFIFRNRPNDLNSLSGNGIWALCEDSEGRIWIGIYGEGLNVLDPRTGSIIRFKNDPEDKFSPCDNRISTIYADHVQKIWIGTDRGGLCWFDPESSKFYPLEIMSEQPIDIGNRIFSFCEDDHNHIWIGTEKGVFRYDSETKTLFDFFKSSNFSSQIIHKYVFDIFKDKTGNLYFATWEGLIKYNLESGYSELFLFPFNQNFQFSPSSVVKLLEDSSDIIWITRQQGGLYQFNPVLKEIKNISFDADDPFGIQSKNLTCIDQDRSGNIWIGTISRGLYELNKKRSAIMHLYQKRHETNSLISNQIRSMFEDSDRKLWFGTINGLSCYDRESNTYTNYQHQEGNPNSISLNRIWVLEGDADNNLWIGTIGAGVDVLNLETGEFSNFRNIPEDTNSLSYNVISEIYQDSRGQIWIGTDGGGLNLYDRGKNSFIHFVHDPENSTSISNDIVMDIKEDRNGYLWIATWGGGLNRFDRNSNEFIHYTHDPGLSHSLSHNIVICILVDRQGNLWAGTYGGGLNRLDPVEDSFSHFSVDDGLPNNNIMGILEDNNAYLWISTHSGLAKFDPVNASFVTFNQQDGLQSNEFNFNACLKTRNGELIFAGDNGASLFYPNSLQKSTFIPPLRFTGIQIFSKESEKNVFLPEDPAIRVSYKDSFLVEFSSLDFTNPSKNQYAYRFEKRQTEWIYLGNTNNITFANLKPDSYKLKIKGTNSDGLWNPQEASLSIHVSPPLWGTWWFRTLIVLACAALLINWHRTRMDRLAQRMKDDVQVERLRQKFQISDREIEIIKLILKGKNRAQISSKLFISESTVKNHIYSLYKKLGIKNRAQLLELFRHLDR